MGGVGVGIVVGWFAFLGVRSVRWFGVGCSVFGWPLLRLGVGGGGGGAFLLVVLVLILILVSTGCVAQSFLH